MKYTIKDNNGNFICSVEDVDPIRSNEGFLDNIKNKSNIKLLGEKNVDLLNKYANSLMKNVPVSIKSIFEKNKNNFKEFIKITPVENKSTKPINDIVFSSILKGVKNNNISKIFEISQTMNVSFKCSTDNETEMIKKFNVFSDDTIDKLIGTNIVSTKCRIEKSSLNGVEGHRENNNTFTITIDVFMTIKHDDQIINNFS